MSLSSPFIRRPVATTLLTVAIALAGAVAFRLLPVSPLPQVDFPTISVQAQMPGASPEIMASAVATPLEREFGRIADVSEMTSQSSLGQTSVTLQFALDRNIDAAARDVQAAINAARSYLPTDLQSNPTYRKVNPADAPIMIISLTSATVPPSGLYDAASTILEQKLSQITGVGQVIVGGSSAPAVRISVNPTQVHSYGLELEDVRKAVAAQTVNEAKGRFTDGRRHTTITANDQLMKAADYRPLIVSYRGNAPVRLSDVASVSDSVQTVRSLGLVNGQRAASVIIFRQPGANIIETVDAIKRAMPGLHAAISPAIDMTIALDQTLTIRASVQEVEHTLGISVVLVILVVFVFLRNPRATLIPAVAVPVSIIATFGVMYLAGYSVDNLSLMALTIATGFVVDDAIVVLENITRYREKGLNAMDAALRGAAEIGSTVMSISISLVAVFIPILMMGGIIGRLFREFAVTLSVTILVSLAVSLTTTPMMCSRLLGVDKGHGRVYQASEKAFDWILARYQTSLRWILEHSFLMLFVTLGTIALTIYLAEIVPKGFFPQQDTGRLSGNIMADESISFQAMEQKMRQLVGIVQSDPGVATVVAFTGGGGGTTTNTGRCFIALKPLAQRKLTADQIINRLRPKLAGVPGATLYLQAVQDVRVGGRSSSAEYQYSIQSDNIPDLNRWGPRLLAAMKKVPQLADVNSDAQNKGLSANLAIDRATAARLGITTAAIDEALYDAFGERQIAKTYTPINQYFVIMEVAPNFWQTPAGLANIYVTSSAGGEVPLAAFTHFQPQIAPLSVSHSGVFPSQTISFNLKPGASLGQAVAAINAVEQKIGMPATITGQFSGTAEAFTSSLANEPLLIAAALAAVYIVLGILYESYIHPITIISTLPSASAGAILALLITHTDLSLIALIGIILLIGIVKKNAIMMIDFALEVEREEKKTPKEAVFQACLLRFRPIMMTTMAALLGGLPLALGTGMGSELRRPLGITIVGGLIVSQALTLFTTPVIYLYMDRLNNWVSRFGFNARRPRLGPAAAALLLLLFLTSCNLAPHYARPSAPTPAAFKEGAGWTTAQPRDDARRSKWWELFGDLALNGLEEKVQVSNQTLAADEASYRQARALAVEARSALFPTVTTSPSSTTFRSSKTLSNSGGGAGAGAAGGTGGTAGGASGGSGQIFSLPVEATYEADLWGRIRNTVAANVYNAQASAGDLASARLSLQAQLAQDYFEVRALDEERRVLDATVGAYRRNLNLVLNLFKNGIDSDLDVAQAQAQLDTTTAQATDLGASRAQYEHAVAVLIGEAPANFSLAPAKFSALAPPIPLFLPSQLVERRPDIAAAERRVAAANAQVGVARSAYFPSLTLSATGGFESSRFAQWLTWPSRFWSLGPQAAETLFDWGERRGENEQAHAAYDQAVANYRQTVLAAFQAVEDNLADVRILAQEAGEYKTAVASSRRYLDLALTRYREGIDSYLNVTAAQTSLLSNEEAAVQVHLRQMLDSVSLVTALGGGWEAGDLPSRHDVMKRPPKWSPASPAGGPNSGPIAPANPPR